MKRNFLKKSLICISLMFFCACGSKNFEKMSFNDGEYEGKYISEETPKSSMVVKIEIKDNKIISCTMEAYDAQDKIKDENYGLEAGEQKYAIAQKSVESMKKYPEKLLEVQDPEKVDAEAGATVSNKEFKSAVWDALEKAKK